MQLEEDVELEALIIQLKNKVQDIRTNKAILHKAINLLNTLSYLDMEVDSEGNIYFSEVDSELLEINETLGSIINYYNDYEKAILETLEEPVPIVEHKLKVYLQNSKKTVRYYYNSTYLFSAPIEIKEELDFHFTKLMNKEPKLSLAEIIEQLEVTKNLLVLFREEPVEVQGLEEHIELEAK